MSHFIGHEIIIIDLRKDFCTGGHDCRFNSCWTPIRVECFEKPGNSRDMRA